MMTKSASHHSNGFKKILVPVDTNKPELSSKLVKHALKIAWIENQISKTEESTVIMLNVIENLKQGGAIGLQAKYGNIQLLDSFMSMREETAIRWMSHAQEKEFEGADLKSEIIQAQGKSLATVIVDYISQNFIDLVVIGAGDLFKKRYLVVGGSITGKVIKKSKCPVLLVQ
jgi:nucleotide-binding universal stress UspA family protein